MAKEPKCYACKDAFPHVREVIEQLCQRSGEAEHGAIVDELMKHLEASGLIQRAVERCPERTREWVAANMVAWLSQHYTMERRGLRDFEARFQRRMLNGSWAYSLRSA
jgi:hypothetical protein